MSNQGITTAQQAFLRHASKNRLFRRANANSVPCKTLQGDCKLPGRHARSDYGDPGRLATTSLRAAPIWYRQARVFGHIRLFPKSVVEAMGRRRVIKRYRLASEQPVSDFGQYLKIPGLA